MGIFQILKYLSTGIGLTFKLVPLVVLTTLIMGTILGMAQFKRIKIISQVIDLYILFMRGVPPLVVLMLLFFSFNLSSSYFTAYLGLSLYHTAYVAEIIRGVLLSVPYGQMEAGQSLGLSFWKIMLKIYIPQITIQAIPALCGQYILVVKDTTLVSVVGAQDVMVCARQLMAAYVNPIVVYFLVGLVYYFLCLVLELLARGFERKAKERYGKDNVAIA